MSDEHNDQKLIIENFNKWVNENDIDQPLEEEELDEILGITAAGVAALSVKFVSTLYSLLRGYNELTKITDEIMASPDAPKQLKDAAAGASQAGGDIESAAGPIADELPMGTKLTHNLINKLLKKHLGVDIDVSKVKLPSISKDEPEPEEEPEPEDVESRKKLGLMSKDKEDRLAQLRSKYRE
jgi:hypothetical protein